jgi:hypothetical protein
MAYDYNVLSTLFKGKKIKVTDFASRHFDRKFGGTKILDLTPDIFEKAINELMEQPFSGFWSELKDKQDVFVEAYEGYAPFCSILIFKNFTEAKVGVMPITLENHQYLRSGYSSRTPEELPVLSRWFELPLSAPKANYLAVVLYSKEQLELENKAELIRKFESYEKRNNKILSEEDKKELSKLDGFKSEFDGTDYQWGVVAILAQTNKTEDPMSPMTMLRNAMGTAEGGSGFPIDRGKYKESVDFWEKNAIIK